MKQRLDIEIVSRGLLDSRHKAQDYIKQGRVSVDGQIAQKPAQIVGAGNNIELIISEKYASRAGFKLASVAVKLNINFAQKIVLDVGSSTGGFSDYALQHGAKKIYAVDVGTNQLVPKLRADERVVVAEKTDIRDVASLPDPIEIALVDVSFISLLKVLPAVARLVKKDGVIIAMAKPQFEASNQSDLHDGVVKNNSVRRRIFSNLEVQLKDLFVITGKADSELAGSKGNVERFYLLKPIR